MIHPPKLESLVQKEIPMFLKLALSLVVAATLAFGVGEASADSPTKRDTCSEKQKKTLTSTTLTCPNDGIRLEILSSGTVRRLCGGHDETFDVGGVAKCYVADGESAHIYYEERKD